MTKLTLVCVITVGLVLLTNSIHADELLKIKQPEGIKIRIEDTGSRVLTQEEARNLSPDQIAVAKPVIDSKPLVDLKASLKLTENSEQPAVAVDPAVDNVNAEKLPPIPLLFPQLPILKNLPPFIQDILNPLMQQQQQQLQQDQQVLTNDETNPNVVDGQPQPPKKIISVLLMRSMKKSDEQPLIGGASSDASASSSDSQQDPQPVVKSSFFIFRLIPKFGGKEDPDNRREPNLFGGDNDVDFKRGQPHLLGGETDIDNKFNVPRVGGGGENDPDMTRFRVNPIFTGNDDLFINSLNNKPISDDSDDQDDDDDDDNNADPKQPSLFSILDVIKKYFIKQGQVKYGDDEMTPPQSIVIKSNDGSSVVLPNEFGYGRPGEEQNKCLMLSFMRLKASMYYRTVLHLLFFSGVLLFVLFMILLTIKSYRKRKYTTLRYFPHNMSVVSTIDGSESESGKEKYKFLRSWTGNDSQLITSPDVKSVLINAPPAYDQASFKPKEVDTTSLPPEYESDEEKSNQQPK